MQELVSSLVTKLVPRGGSILVVGCGTGEDILRLEKTSHNFKILGIDPSQEMLKIAKTKVGSQLQSSTLEEMEGEAQFDCVVSILVSHFFEKGEKKNKFFGSISSQLKSGGVFVGADYMNLGLDEFHMDVFQKKIGSVFHPVSEEELSLMLAANGLSNARYFFNSLGFQGYFAKKK